MIFFAQIDFTALRDVMQARIIAMEAETHFKRGEYIDAANEYEEAFGLYRDPTLLFNEALAWGKLGYFAFAYASVERYLGFPSLPPDERTQGRAMEADLQLRMSEGPHLREHVQWSHREHDRRFPHGHKHVR